MAVNITVAGVSYSVPSSAADVNWAAQQLAFEQALAAQGNTSVQRLYANSVPVGTGLDNTEDTLMSYTLPAGALSTAAKCLRVTAWGTGANVSQTTTLRAYFGATKLLEASLGTGQPNTWRVQYECLAVGASSQAASLLYFNGEADSWVYLPASPAETAASQILLKFTGQKASPGTTANAVVQVGMTVELIP